MALPAAEHLEAWRLFLTAHHEVLDLLAAELESETGLPLTWYEVLLYLERAPDQRLRMHELADSLLLSRSAVTRFVDRIERAGYVRRRRCTTDRRGLFVELTADGEAVFRSAAPVHLRGVEEHFTRFLDDDTAAAMQQAFARIAGAARSGADQSPRIPTTSSTS